MPGRTKEKKKVSSIRRRGDPCFGEGGISIKTSGISKEKISPIHF